MKDKLKICHISPGNIEIPPKGWGAIEKVIWNYKIQLEKLGHTVDICVPQKFVDKNYDIIHCHMYNQAVTDIYEIHKKRFLFSLHDHHAYKWGKDSKVFKDNLDAMKKSIISITHAEYLIDYFDQTDKLFFLSHGVDTEKYKFKDYKKLSHKLLCVANNGLIGKPEEDRKGFRYAIEAAKELDLPITIVGPNGNKSFFDHHKDLLEYDRLNIISDPGEDELVEIYNSHTIFLHQSNLEAGQPNLTLLESLSCGLLVVGTYSGKKEIGGLIRTKLDTNDVVKKIRYVINNYNLLQQKSLESVKEYDWSNIVKLLEQIYYNIKEIDEKFDNERVRDKIIDIYDNTPIKIQNPIKTKITTDINMNDGLSITLSSSITMKKKFDIKIYDLKSNNIVYETQIPKDGILENGKRYWTKLNKKCFNEYRISMKDLEDNEDYEVITNFENKNVFIKFESKSLGDTICWVPYVEEFRRKHNCNVYCTTHHNYLFEKEYPDIKFVGFDYDFPPIYATYKTGWFSPPWGGNRDLHPNDYRTIPLQQTISDILGLEFKEIRPKVSFEKGEKPIKGKYICISEHSTAGAKYWNYPNGWQILCDELKSLGFQVVVVSKEKTNLTNIIDRTGLPLKELMNIIYHSEFLITVSSGLSWLTWALGKKTVMISGFSKPEFEFKENIIRIHNPNVCNGCFNDTRFDFDRGDWNWCPVNKDNVDKFICSKSITPEMVIHKIKNEFVL